MNYLVLLTLCLAGAAATIQAAYLVFRPKFHLSTKVWLLLGLGILPIGTALTGNLANFTAMKQRTFCGSCHEMTPYALGVQDVSSMSLSSIHSRNREFGSESCYSCHRDYEMFGTITTKVTGLRHLWASFTRDSSQAISLYRPFPNANCSRCHSTTLPGFVDEPEHLAVEMDIKLGDISCAAEGCHGPSHRFLEVPSSQAP